VRVPNDPGDGSLGAFSDLLRLQTEFQSRLAEETLRYLRKLQGASAPATPGTVLMPGATIELRASGTQGGVVELALEVENRQRAHSVVTPMLSPMASASGVTWFPAADPSPASLLLAPEEVATLAIRIPLPDNLPDGAYRGALLLQGFREGAIAVAIDVGRPPAPKPSGGRRPAGKKAAAKKAAKTGGAKAPGGRREPRGRK
jgi:hypothetical protein